MMDPNLKARWIRALRSHRYSQGQKFLEHHEKRTGRPDRITNCCLGVLCRLARIPGEGVNLVSFDGYVSSLSFKLLRKFGLSDADQAQLIALNDGTDGNRVYSFLEIAAWLEANDRV